MRKIFWIYLCTFVLSNCQTPDHTPNVKTSKYASQNLEDWYQKAYENYTRNETVYYNYETLYTISATYFSTDFYSSFTSLKNEKYIGKEYRREIKAGKSFLISIFSPNNAYNKLKDEQLWTLRLDIEGKEYPVKTLKKIEQKNSWYVFFPYLNRWSSDFIVVFDVPEEVFHSEQKVTLKLSNTKAHTEMKW